MLRWDGRLALVVGAAIGALLVGIDVALVLLEDQPEAAALGVVPAQLAEQAVAVGVFRVGFAAREPGAAVAAVGFGLVALAVAIMQQAVEVVGAAGDGGRGQPGVACRLVAGLQPGADVLAVLDDVRRVEGEVAHRAADGVAAVQRRGRAAKDFHALYDVRIDVVAVGLRVGAAEEVVGQFDPVDLRKDAVPVDAADVVAGDPGTLAGAADRDSRFVAHQFLDVVDVLPVQLFAGLHADGARHRIHCLLGTGGGDGGRGQRDGVPRQSQGRAEQQQGQAGRRAKGGESGMWDSLGRAGGE